MPSIQENVNDFIELIKNAKNMEAFNKYYSLEVEMIELDGTSFRGFELNKKREEEFFSKITALRKFSVIGFIINNNQAFIVYDMDLDHAMFGRMNLQEVAIQTWENGKIIREKFSA